MDAAELALQGTLFGVGGWTLENVFFGPRFSTVFDGVQIPFLPVYAFGGMTIMATRPYLDKLPWIVRVPIYSALLTGVEFAGCQINRRVFGSCSWDYSNQNCANPWAGCIDLDHGLLWGILGVAVEGIVWLVDRVALRPSRGTVCGRGHRSVRVQGTRQGRRSVRQGATDQERGLRIRQARLRSARVRDALSENSLRLDRRRRSARQVDAHDGLSQVS